MVDSQIGSKSLIPQREEGLRKRENFAVTLRKSKKSEILQVKRLRLLNQVSFASLEKDWRNCGYYLDCHEVFRDLQLVQRMLITSNPTQNDSAPYSFQKMLDHYVQPTLLQFDQT